MRVHIPTDLNTRCEVTFCHKSNPRTISPRHTTLPFLQAPFHSHPWRVNCTLYVRLRVISLLSKIQSARRKIASDFFLFRWWPVGGSWSWRWNCRLHYRLHVSRRTRKRENLVVPVWGSEVTFCKILIYCGILEECLLLGVNVVEDSRILKWVSIELLQWWCMVDQDGVSVSVALLALW